MTDQHPDHSEPLILAADADGDLTFVEVDDLPDGALVAVELRPREVQRMRAAARLDAAREALAALPADASPYRRSIAAADVRRAARVVDGEQRLEQQRHDFAIGDDPPPSAVDLRRRIRHRGHPGL